MCYWSLLWFVQRCVFQRVGLRVGQFRPTRVGYFLLFLIPLFCLTLWTVHGDHACMLMPCWYMYLLVHTMEGWKARALQQFMLPSSLLYGRAMHSLQCLFFPLVHVTHTEVARYALSRHAQLCPLSFVLVMFSISFQTQPMPRRHAQPPPLVF